MTQTTYAHNQVLMADQLNTDFARTIDRAGDNMTGFLRLFTAPSNPMDAVTKQYVDQAVVGNVGTGYLPLSGGTLTGPLNYTATGATTSRSAQNRAIDVVNVMDFGADLTGVADSAPAFNAAIASVASGGNVKVYVPNGTYLLNSTVSNNGRYAYLDLTSGAKVGAYNGGLGTGTLFVHRIDAYQSGGKWYQFLQDNPTAGSVQYDISIQTHAAQPSAYYRLYQQFGSTLTAGQSDIAARESSDWSHVAGAGCSLWGTWHTNTSPYLNAADVTASATFAFWGIELNIANNGPDYQWTEFDPNQTGASVGVPANWTGGILVTPDVWAPSGSQGGHMTVGFVVSDGGMNARTASPSQPHWPASATGAYRAKIFSGFHAKNNAIAPGGRAFYAGGDTTGTVGLYPQSPFEARHNFASGIHTDQATFADGFALTMATNQGIAWGTGPTIRSGTGAATGTQPKGSLWMRTDGAVGSTLYVSQGGGTWNAVAGV